MFTPVIGSLEQTYAEAKEFAARFGSPYLVYRPVEDKPDFYAVMPKRFFETISANPVMRGMSEKILRETAVIVSPPAPSVSF